MNRYGKLETITKPRPQAVTKGLGTPRLETHGMILGLFPLLGAVLLLGTRFFKKTTAEPLSVSLV